MTETGDHIPIMLRVRGRTCLVVGGGRVATRKVRALLAAGAAITVVSPQVSATLATLALAGALRHVARRFAEADLRGQFLVLAATDDSAVNQRVVQGCRRRRVLCAVVDASWAQGDFFTPAAFQFDGLTVAVSSGGRDYRRAKRVGEALRAQLGETAALREPS